MCPFNKKRFYYNCVYNISLSVVINNCTILNSGCKSFSFYGSQIPVCFKELCIGNFFKILIFLIILISMCKIFCTCQLLHNSSDENVKLGIDGLKF